MLAMTRNIIFGRGLNINGSEIDNENENKSENESVDDEKKNE